MTASAEKAVRDQDGTRADDFNPMDTAVGYKLRRAQLSTFQDFIERFKAIDLRPAEFSVLRIIKERPGLRHAEVARMLGIKRTNFVALMDGLERRGLADRQTSDVDRRSHELYLTEQGHAFLAQAMVVFDRLEADMLRRLGGPKARDTLIELLSRLIDEE